MKKGRGKNKEGLLVREEVITISELAYFLGMRRRILQRLVMLDVIEPLLYEPEFTFSVEILPRLEKIIRLRNQLRVSWSSMALVLELLDRIEDMEARLGGK